MGKIYYVDFDRKELKDVEFVENEPEEKLDPVLERIKNKMDPESFKIFKRTVDVWMEENFLYEMEERNNNSDDWLEEVEI